MLGSFLHRFQRWQYLFQINQTALFGCANDDVFEIFNFIDASLSLQRIGHLLAAVAGHRADTAERRLVVLRPSMACFNAADGNVQRGQFYRHPAKRAYLNAPRNADFAHAGYTAQTVFNVVLDIVGQL